MYSTIPAGAFRTARDAIFVVDDERLLVEANAAACSLTGLPHAELTRRVLDDFLSVASRRDMDARWGRFLLSGRGHGRCRFVRPDGAGRTVTYVARSNTPFRGFHLSVARPAPRPGGVGEGGAGGEEGDGERRPDEIEVERTHDAVVGELWDVLDEVAADPALVDALETGRDAGGRSEVA